MSNAALASSNLIDRTATVVTALGAASGSTPATLLQNPHVGKRWRHNASTTWVLADLGALFNIDTIMLAGVAGPNIPVFQVRLSTADSTGAAGDANNSGLLTGLPYFDSDYEKFIYLLSSPVSARYVRVDFTDASSPATGPYTEAGRWFAGVRNQFTTNYQAGWQNTVVRGSVDVPGVGGQTFVDLRRGHVATQVTFNFVTETERTTFLDDIGVALLNIGHLDMLWLKDPASSNLSRDSVWGYFDGDPQLSQQFTFTTLYTLAFTIRQRL